MDNLQNYIQENHPNIIKEYERYIRKDTPLKIGTLVKCLRSGYGGMAGVERKVKNYFDKGKQKPFTSLKGEFQCNVMVLTDGERNYWLDFENWWKEVEILKEKV